MTIATLEEMAAIEAKASKGPWKVRRIAYGDADIGTPAQWEVDESDESATDAYIDGEACANLGFFQDDKHRNASFVAAAREFVPWALARIRELEKERENAASLEDYDDALHRIAFAEDRIKELERHEMRVAEAVGVIYEADGCACAPGPMAEVVLTIAENRKAREDGEALRQRNVKLHRRAQLAESMLGRGVVPEEEIRRLREAVRAADRGVRNTVRQCERDMARLQQVYWQAEADVISLRALLANAIKMTDYDSVLQAVRLANDRVKQLETERNDSFHRNNILLERLSARLLEVHKLHARIAELEARVQSLGEIAETERRMRELVDAGDRRDWDEVTRLEGELDALKGKP